MKGSIEKRVGKKGNITWRIRYDLPGDGSAGRKTRSLSIKGSKREAERTLRQILNQIDKGQFPDNRKLTVRQYMDMWFENYVVANTRAQTQKRYAIDIRNHIFPAIGGMRLKNVTAVDIQAIESRMRKNGNAPRTIRNLHRTLSMALKHAVQSGLIYSNPAQFIKAPTSKGQSIELPQLSEILQIIEEANKTPYGTVIDFLARTGSRRSEALALRWSDLDFDKSTVSINRALTRDVDRQLCFAPCKTDKSRRLISIDKDTLDMLRKHRGNQILLSTDLPRNNTLVFSNHLGNVIDPDVLTRNFIKIRNRLGLRSIRLHDLRHFHASLLLKQGVHLKVVQERLGHSNIAVTADVYSHVTPSLHKEAADAFAQGMKI